MSFQNQFTKTTTDANLMETVHHGSAEYPFRYYYENIALFDFKCIDWHWHSELEFIYIESGNVVFDIGTVHFELKSGNIFLCEVDHKLFRHGIGQTSAEKLTFDHIDGSNCIDADDIFCCCVAR